MSVLRIHLLGGLFLTWEGTPLATISGVTARSLFGYLVTYRYRSHTRDLLAGIFWPDVPDTVARRRLSQALWQIRRALNPLPILLTEGDTVQLNPDLPLWLDAAAFAEAVERKTGDQLLVRQAADLQDLSEAVELYRGDFLAGYYDDWILPEREQLRDLLLGALRQLISGYKSLSEYERALALARRLAREDPWREQAQREVMRLCYLLGRGNEALEQFETCRRILAQELGSEPSPRTVALAREIAVRHASAVPATLPGYLPAPAPVFLSDREAPALPLVGRETERTALLTHVEALFQGLGGVVLIEGEAGVGKTRLLQAVSRDAEWRGAEVLWAGGQEDGAMMPYGPLLGALNEGLSPLRAGQLAKLVAGIWLQVLADLLPSLAAAAPDLPPPPKLEPAQERDRLVTALAQLLAGWTQIAPLLLVLEDLHWVGQDVLDLLARLAPALSEQAVLVVGSYRSEEARAQAKIWQKVRALDRAGIKHRLALNGLDAATTGELIRRCLGMGRPAPLFESRLYQETQGNPLFVLETLRALHGEGLLSRDGDGQWSTPWDKTTADYAELPLPPAVEQIIARRLATLPPALERTIRLAAVLGERFDFTLLHAASDQEPPALLAALHGLVQRHFLTEAERDYRFSHAKVRQVAYEGISAPARSGLHRRAAEALEILQPHRLAALAHHWTQARVWDRAADYHQQAGDGARAAYSNAEAASYYGQALAALERLPGPPDLDRAFELLLAREAMYDLMGERAAQAEDLVALEALAEDGDNNRQRLEVTLRRVHYAQEIGDYSAADQAAQKSIDLAHRVGDVGAEAAGHFYRGSGYWLQGDCQRARPELEQALSMVQEAQTGVQSSSGSGRSSAEALRQMEGDSLRLLGNVCGYLNDYAGAIAYYERSLRIYQEIGDRQGEGSTLNNIGSVLYDKGDCIRSREHLERALGILREVGDRRAEGNTLTNLGSTIVEQGDYAQGLTYLDQALLVYRRIGDRHGVGWLLNSLGQFAVCFGDYAGAKAYCEQALQICRQVGDRLGEAWGLANLSLYAHYRGDNESGQEYAQQAVRITQELGERFNQAHALKNLGHALAAQGRLAGGADAYQRALDLRRELGQPGLIMDPLAGLARVQLSQGNLSQAQAHVDEILHYLQARSGAGINEPFRVYLTCYRVLLAAQDSRAEDVLATAHALLQGQAAQMANEEMRRAFLENVAAHRELVAAYRELEDSQRAGLLQVRLPRARAPLGRPLRDDEYVTVTWTVDAPEDRALARKTTRRHRILRLLAEAQAQGAAPRDEDLAAALGVGLRTLRRDMATLRAEGHSLPTRWRRRKMAT